MVVQYHLTGGAAIFPATERFVHFTRNAMREMIRSRSVTGIPTTTVGTGSSIRQPSIGMQNE